MGDVLADYEDAGGVVVGMGFDWYSSPFNLQGRWITGGYSPFNVPAPSLFITGTLGTTDASSPVMLGVHSASAFYRLDVTVASGATQVAAWNDGKPAVAVKGRAVGISAYTGDYAPLWSGDFARIIADAGFTLRRAQDVCASVHVPIVIR